MKVVAPPVRRWILLQVSGYRARTGEKIEGNLLHFFFRCFFSFYSFQLSAFTIFFVFNFYSYISTFFFFVSIRIPNTLFTNKSSPFPVFFFHTSFPIRAFVNYHNFYTYISVYAAYFKYYGNERTIYFITEIIRLYQQ